MYHKSQYMYMYNSIILLKTLKYSYEVCTCTHSRFHKGNFWFGGGNNVSLKENLKSSNHQIRL